MTAKEAKEIADKAYPTRLQEWLDRVLGSIADAAKDGKSYIKFRGGEYMSHVVYEVAHRLQKLGYYAEVDDMGIDISWSNPK